MKIIKPYTEIIDFCGDPLKHIELCGRVCYKSEEKITDDSASKFVKNIITCGHESVLEHFRVVVEVPNSLLTDYFWKLFMGFDSIEISQDALVGLVSGNVRGFRDVARYLESKGVACTVSELIIVKAVIDAYPAFFCDCLEPVFGCSDIKVFPAETYNYTSQSEKMLHCPKTVRFVCDRGVSHELVRHRKASFSQESTRYCDYGGGVTFIAPCFLPDFDELLGITCTYDTVNHIRMLYDRSFLQWFVHMLDSEESYKRLLGWGKTPQEARSILPNSTKTEVVMTTTLKWWNHFFSLRDSAKAHPQMRELAAPLHKQFIENGWIS